VTAAGEEGVAEGDEDCFCEAGAGYALAQAEDVGVVVLARHPGAVGVGDAGGARARYLVGSDRDADARTAHQEP
jgi:hypothetical protein